MLKSNLLHTQLLVLGALIAATVFIAVHPGVRALIARATQVAVGTLRFISSCLAVVLDWVVPINPKNGRIPPVRFGLWILLNCAVVVAWVYADLHASIEAVQVVGAVDLAFAVANLIFLLGAHSALREGIAIMNGDQPYRRRQFADLSTSKNVLMVCAASILVILQIAAVLQWLQNVYKIQLVAVNRTLGIAYLDFLVATANALPFLSFYLETPGFSDHVAFASSAGSWCLKTLNALGSVLIVSTIIGFVQQHVVFRKMIEDLLTKTDTKVLPLLKERFLRAPSAIKSYVRAAFQAQTDDDKRLKLVRLAVAKHSYSFPAVFIKRYSTLGDKVKQDGAAALADFIERKGHQFDRSALSEITEAASIAYTKGVLKKLDDRQRIGAIILPCIEQLSDCGRFDVSAARSGIELSRQKPLQSMLCALLNQGSTEQRRARTAELLMRSRAQAAIPEILRCLQHMNDGIRIRLLENITELIRDRGITFALSADNDPLGEIVRTIDWNSHNVNFSSASAAALKRVRAAAVEKRSVGRESRR